MDLRELQWVAENAPCMQRKPLPECIDHQWRSLGGGARECRSCGMIVGPLNAEGTSD